MNFGISLKSITVAAALFLLGGCVHAIDELKPKSNASSEFICFDVSPLIQLEEDDTKAILKEGTEFDVNDIISVYGRHHSSESDDNIFTAQNVTKVSSGWNYAPVKSWEWESGADYYDFISVYPTTAPSSRMDIPGNIAVKADYNIASDNYDLLCSAIRRGGNEANRNRIVPFSFQHMLSAVKVVIINDSDDTDFTIDEISFKNLIISGSLKATIDAIGNPEYLWIDIERSSGLVRSWNPASTTLYGKNNTGAHSYEKENPFDLMIPGSLTTTSNGSNDDNYLPQIIVKYTPTGGVQRTPPPIILKNIERSDHTPITSWSPATKYAYYITIRADGGVLVKVITTEWNTVNAETPGLLID